MPANLSQRSKFLITKHLSYGLLVSLSFSLLLLTSPCEAKDPGNAAMFSRSKMLDLVNRARQAGQYCGKKWYTPVKKLNWNDQLEEAAKAHSQDMYENNFFSHKGSNNLYVDDRIYTQHYFWTACGENVAYGALYEDDVMKEWLKSPGHCVNIMNPGYTEMGAWLSGLYWTQVLAKPQQ